MTHYDIHGTETIKVRYHEGASKMERHGAMMDLAASETVELKQGEVKVIPLGVSVKLPEGMWGLVVPRSSTCRKHGIMMANSVGVIENDYCGDGDVWGFVAYAVRDTVIEQGTRIAQFEPRKYFDWDAHPIEEVESMPYPDRGGFGSTDKPKPKPRDCHGREIHVGDWVTVSGGSAYKVVRISEESGWPVIEGRGKRSLRRFSPHSCFICPLGADGKPLLIGETVYTSGGIAMKIEKFDHEAVYAERTNGQWADWFDPSKLTHEAPDSWDRYRADLTLSSSLYCGHRGINAEETECFDAMLDDLVARAKRLAGAE